MARYETRFRLSAKRTSTFKSAGASVQSTTGSRGVRISGSNAGCTMFRGSVTSTGYPLHSPVSPSLPPVCPRVPSHFNWTLPRAATNGIYNSQIPTSFITMLVFEIKCWCSVIISLILPGVHGMFCTVHALYTKSSRSNTHLIPPHTTLLEDTITMLDGKSSALFTLLVLVAGSAFEHVYGCVNVQCMFRMYMLRLSL
jgi:hypothetical protein